MHSRNVWISKPATWGECIVNETFYNSTAYSYPGQAEISVCQYCSIGHICTQPLELVDDASNIVCDDDVCSDEQCCELSNSCIDV